VLDEQCIRAEDVIQAWASCLSLETRNREFARGSV